MTPTLDDTVAILDRLIAFDTTSRNSNLDLISYVQDYLLRWKVDSHLVHNETGTKANLYATIGPDVEGGVILSGHTDVVPVDGQDWSTDPFTLVRTEDRLFGRGVADMKSFIAVCLAFVPRFTSQALRQPIHLAFSFDEEIGCKGVGSLIDRIGTDFPRPQIAIIGEPSDMKVVNRHKGIRTFVTHVIGREAHSSKQNLGVNAISAAAELIGFLSEIADEMAAEDRLDTAFEPPYTTLNVGKITGGSAINIIAKECTFSWEYRCLPGTDETEIIKR